jgi:hypothetical protein
MRSVSLPVQQYPDMAIDPIISIQAGNMSPALCVALNDIAQVRTFNFCSDWISFGNSLIVTAACVTCALACACVNFARVYDRHV